MSDTILLFLIANSILINIFPLILLNQMNDLLTEEEQKEMWISPTLMYVVIPLLMGILFPLLYANIPGFIPRKLNNIYLRFNLAGAMSALLISILLQSSMGLYDKLDFENPILVHLSVFVFYFIIFQLVGIWSYKKVAGCFAERYNPTTKQTPSFSPPQSPEITKRKQMLEQLITKDKNKKTMRD